LQDKFDFPMFVRWIKR